MKFSLRKKTVLLISLMMLVVCVVGSFLNRRFISAITDGHYSEDSMAIANTVASVIDAGQVLRLRDQVVDIYDKADNKIRSDEWGSPEFDAYMSRYDIVAESPDFVALRDWMRNFQENSEVDCIYLMWIDPERKNWVYLCDAAVEDACPPGCIDEIYPVNYPTLEDPERGFPPYETNTNEYGWLVTAAAPIHYNGEVIAYAAVDISMEEISRLLHYYGSINIWIHVALTVIMGIIGILVVNHYVIKPVNQLSKVASTYKGVSPELGGLERNDFSMLNIKTGDEIEVLAASMKKMESDLNDQIETLFATRQELITTREQADIMNEMANRDALTGIRNKRGYDTEIQRINKEIVGGNTNVGIVMVDMNGLKNINDSYGHEKGDRVICSLCDVLCSIFKRSPVFRIGGDEFVVVVERQDFKNLDKNVEQFKACIEHNMTEEDLEPWERVSAAIGYAIYDSGKDCGIEDTLKRADEKMYENKREMKS
ncbi:MAG: diguanylate cyclase [Lachnospiraceae bacterium]|nr:diguanylate cyclase [Lachnospiraceae bacterium]